MKVVLFVLLITLALCQKIEEHVFRYLNGHLKIGNNWNMTVDGSMYYDKVSQDELGELITLEFVGLEMSTKTSFSVVGTYTDFGDTKDGADIDLTLDCVTGAWGQDDPEVLFGTITLKGSWDAAVLSGDCATVRRNDWIFGAVGTKSKTYYYPPAEAGMRAKNLIGQSIERYEAPHVIYYAIRDDPYSEVTCRDMLGPFFPDAPGPEPGALIVAKDGSHCAILDNEGTKFTHSSRKNRVVAYDSIATISTHFPSGHVYKRYSDELSLTYMKYHLRGAKY